MKRPQRAFSLIELLAVASVIIVLLGLALPAMSSARSASWKAVSTHTLKNAITAGHAYLAENDGVFWPYKRVVAEGTRWWFGYEPAASRTLPDGERWLEHENSDLGPYVIAAGGWSTDPAFLAVGSRHKPKFKNGNFGFAYNTLLGRGWQGVGTAIRSSTVVRPGELLVFVTSAQVNTFQPPASAKKPMLEEFYGIDDGMNSRVAHFRHGGKALAAFFDGSVRELEMRPGTRDNKMPSANVGCLPNGPRGSYLRITE